MAGTLKDYTRWIKNEKNSLRPPHQKKKKKKEKLYRRSISSMYRVEVYRSHFDSGILTVFTHMEFMWWALFQTRPSAYC